MGYGRHAPLDLPPGVDKRPVQRGARLPPLPPGHSARSYIEGPHTARARSENPPQAAPRPSRQRKVDINALLAQLQAFHEAKAKAVEDEDYSEAARLKQLIAEIEVALEGVDFGEQAVPQPPHPPATGLAGSIYDVPQGAMNRRPPAEPPRRVPVRSQRNMRGSPDLSEDSSHGVSARGGGSHLREASEAAQACVPPPRGGRKSKESTSPSAPPPEAKIPVPNEAQPSNQYSEEALGFETEDLLQGIVERNLLDQGGDIPSSADTVEDADYDMEMQVYSQAASFPSGPAPTLDDLLTGNAGKRALRPVKEPARGRSRPPPQRNGMHHVPVPPPLPKQRGDPQDNFRIGLEEKTRMQKRLDAIDRRQPFTAR